MVNNLPPLSGPVDASGEPTIVGYRAPITSAPYCLDCVRQHQPWFDTHDPPPVYDTHETCINCGKSLRAAAVPSPPAQEQKDRAWHIMDRIYKKVVAMTTGLPWPTTAFYDFGVPIIAAELPPSSPVADSPTWQPIKTAPKDGRYVLLYEREWGGNGQFITMGRWVNYSRALDGEAGWVRYGVGNIAAERLTHWMPLPSAPSPSAGAAKEQK